MAETIHPVRQKDPENIFKYNDNGQRDIRRKQRGAGIKNKRLFIWALGEERYGDDKNGEGQRSKQNERKPTIHNNPSSFHNGNK